MMFSKSMEIFYIRIILKCPLFSTITYLNDSIHPTIITDILNNDIDNIEYLKNEILPIYYIDKEKAFDTCIDLYQRKEVRNMDEFKIFFSTQNFFG
jgi:hypothetical protein